MLLRSSGLVLALAAILAVGTGCPVGTSAPDGGATDSGNNGQDSGSGNDAGSESDAGAGMDAGANDAGTDAGATVTITATRVIHHLTDTTQVDVPANLSNSVIEVLVADANADGGYDVYPGAAVDAGLLAVPNVPASALSGYYLRLGNTWYEATAASIDLSAYQVGRPNGSTPDAGTDIQVDLHNLSPWVDGLTFVPLVSAGAGVDMDLVTALDAGSGATTASGLVVYPKASDRIDASQGDVTVLYESTGQIDGGVILFEAARGGVLPGFTVADGVTTELDAGLPALPQRPVSWTFSGTTFDALGVDVNPSASAGLQDVGIQAVVAGGAHGPVGAAPNLFDSSLRPSLAADYAVAGSYGNPFPSSWGLVGLASELWTVRHNLPFDGGTVVDIEDGVVNVEDLLATFPPADGGTLTPVISPALNLSADGQGGGDQTLLSTAPLLTWDAPSLGTPSYYVITITHLTVGPAGGVGRFSLTVYTSQTSVQLFPGLLVSGAQYVVRISAVAALNSTFATHPLFETFPVATAETLSGLWTTP